MGIRGKVLTLMRHGKSSWDYEVSDQNRPLLERGIRDAEVVGKHVRSSLVMPEAVFSSPANRALHTCIIAMRALELPFKLLEVTPLLYDFSGHQVQQFIHDLDDRWQSVMIFGHNHAFTSISNIFGSENIVNLPTAGLVQIHFSEERWADVQQGTTKITVFPKQIR